MQAEQRAEGRAQAVELWAVAATLQGVDRRHDVNAQRASWRDCRDAVRAAREAVGPCVCTSLRVAGWMRTAEAAEQCAQLVRDSLQRHGKLCRICGAV